MYRAILEYATYLVLDLLIERNVLSATCCVLCRIGFPRTLMHYLLIEGDVLSATCYVLCRIGLPRTLCILVVIALWRVCFSGFLCFGGCYHNSTILFANSATISFGKLRQCEECPVGVVAALGQLIIKKIA